MTRWLVALLGLMTICPLNSTAADRQPNIILLLTDDQRFDTIRQLGHPEVITPNLDRLAREGVAFTNAYNMGGWNGAICLASRAMLNTGRFLWHAHQVDKSLKNEVQQQRLLSQMLSQAGYQTYMTGKWHVSVDAKSVFDQARNVRGGMPGTVNAAYGRPNDKDDWHPWDTELGGFWQGGKHWSEVVADDAESFLKAAAVSDKPFFMYLAFNAPHDPRQSPREFVEMYDRATLSVAPNFVPQNPYMDMMGAGRSLRDEQLASWPRSIEAVQLHQQEYYALITHLDQQIGRILQALQATGKAENTIVVMTADHGLACGQHGLLGKQSMYEHSMKAPLIVTGPGIPSDQRINTPVYIQDFVPTALELAGAVPSDHIEFRSLLPLIRGERETQYPYIYGAYTERHQRMVRYNDWKLIHYPAGDVYLMFDLKHDPYELHDLAGKPEHAQTLADMKLKLRQAMKEMDDPLVAAAK